MPSERITPVNVLSLRPGLEAQFPVEHARAELLRLAIDDNATGGRVVIDFHSAVDAHSTQIGRHSLADFASLGVIGIRGQQRDIETIGISRPQPEVPWAFSGS